MKIGGGRRPPYHACPPPLRVPAGTHEGSHAAADSIGTSDCVAASNTVRRLRRRMKANRLSLRTASPLSSWRQAITPALFFFFILHRSVNRRPVLRPRGRLAARTDLRGGFLMKIILLGPFFLGHLGQCENGRCLSFVQLAWCAVAVQGCLVLVHAGAFYVSASNAMTSVLALTCWQGFEQTATVRRSLVDPEPGTRVPQQKEKEGTRHHGDARTSNHDGSSSRGDTRSESDV